MEVGWYMCHWADGGNGNRWAGEQVIGTGGNTGVTAGQMGVVGSEMTGELVNGK